MTSMVMPLPDQTVSVALEVLQEASEVLILVREERVISATFSSSQATADLLSIRLDSRTSPAVVEGSLEALVEQEDSVTYFKI